MTIEIATPEDWPAMRQVFQNAGRAAWGHIMSEEALAGLEPPDRWRGAIDDPEQRVLVAKKDEEVKGFAVLKENVVDSFYTDPSVWGEGVGQKLMQASLEFLREQGYQEAILWTEVRNHRPRKFYEKAGWQPDGVSKKRTVRDCDIEELRYRIALGPNQR